MTDDLTDLSKRAVVVVCHQDTGLMAEEGKETHVVDEDFFAARHNVPCIHVEYLKDNDFHRRAEDGNFVYTLDAWLNRSGDRIITLKAHRIRRGRQIGSREKLFKRVNGVPVPW